MSNYNLKLHAILLLFHFVSFLFVIRHFFRLRLDLKGRVSAVRGEGDGEGEDEDEDESMRV
jgi:hypothetical protein